MHVNVYNYIYVSWVERYLYFPCCPLTPLIFATRLSSSYVHIPEQQEVLGLNHTALSLDGESVTCIDILFVPITPDHALGRVKLHLRSQLCPRSGCVCDFERKFAGGKNSNPLLYCVNLISIKETSRLEDILDSSGMRGIWGRE